MRYNKKEIEDNEKAWVAEVRESEKERKRLMKIQKKCSHEYEEPRLIDGANYNTYYLFQCVYCGYFESMEPWKYERLKKRHEQ